MILNVFVVFVVVKASVGNFGDLSFSFLNNRVLICIQKCGQTVVGKSSVGSCLENIVGQGATVLY